MLANQLKGQITQLLSRMDAPHSSSAQVDQWIIHIVHLILHCAIVMGSSDIHIEPTEEALCLRLRKLGHLQDFLTIDRDFSQRIINRIKVMAQLDISQSLLPQDGRLCFSYSDCPESEFRISTCPTLHGEKMVLRLLKNQQLLSPSELGMLPCQEQHFLAQLSRKQGLILITGPTGSGKTTTLYSGMKTINHPSINILTIEDPIEIPLPGINQVNVNPKVGLNFANTLRAFLRQDPDVIMIGEIRDQETAEIALKAAQTGHLVLASLHTNSAIHAINRLVHMGIPKYAIIDGLSLIIAQRMVRKRCPFCRNQHPHPSNNNCESGFIGREGIFETLVCDESLKTCLAKTTDMKTIKQALQEIGHIDLAQSAKIKLEQHLIDEQEVLYLGL